MTYRHIFPRDKENFGDIKVFNQNP